MTSKENLALNLMFATMGESPDNRSMDHYIAIAIRAPKLSVLLADVNNILEQMAIAGRMPYSICYFKAGDRNAWYEEFPTRLSIETIRQAWKKSGMRELQRLFKPRKHK